MNKLKFGVNPEWIQETPGNPGGRVRKIHGVNTTSINNYQGKLWALRYPPTDGREETKAMELWLASSADGVKWEPQGKVSVDSVSSFKNDLPWILLPLGNDSFLGAHANPRRVEKECSYFAIYRLKNGSVNFDHLCKMGLDEELQVPNKNAPSGFGPNPKLASLFLLPVEMRATGYIRTENVICFAMPSPGLIWVFDTEKGSLKGMYPLYSKVIPLLGHPEAIETAIHRWQPRPDGHLLISTRSEEAVIESRKLYPTCIPQPPISQEDFANPIRMEELKKEMMLVMSPAFIRFPEILWWDFDPLSGVFKKEEAPLGAPEKVWDGSEWESLRFEHRIDGTLKVDFLFSNADPMRPKVR